MVVGIAGIAVEVVRPSDSTHSIGIGTPHSRRPNIALPEVIWFILNGKLQTVLFDEALCMRIGEVKVDDGLEAAVVHRLSCLVHHERVEDEYLTLALHVLLIHWRRLHQTVVGWHVASAHLPGWRIQVARLLRLLLLMLLMLHCLLMLLRWHVHGNATVHWWPCHVPYRRWRYHFI